jgi:hypothetical protein
MEENKPIYNVMKVFDCQWDPGMPEDVKDAFFKFVRETSDAGNDIYINWEINCDVSDELLSLQKKVDDWLIANGTSPGSEGEEGETVLIHHWW